MELILYWFRRLEIVGSPLVNMTLSTFVEYCISYVKMYYMYLCCIYFII